MEAFFHIGKVEELRMTAYEQAELEAFFHIGKVEELRMKKRNLSVNLILILHS